MEAPLPHETCPACGQRVPAVCPECKHADSKRSGTCWKAVLCWCDGFARDTSHWDDKTFAWVTETQNRFPQHPPGPSCRVGASESERESCACSHEFHSAGPS